MHEIKWALNGLTKADDGNLAIMSREKCRAAERFLTSVPGFRPTPLCSLSKLSDVLGLESIFVKDESRRFNLNSFKPLGSSYAIGRCIAEIDGLDPETLNYADLLSRENSVQNAITFVAATDGNHGRGIAWAANRLGEKAVILLPRWSTKRRVDNIRKEGAQVSVEDLNYEECVRKASKIADETEGAVLVQDTSWPGYEKIPAWIMQGYGVMASEADKQIKAMDSFPPTHVFLQAGAGLMAGAVIGYFANNYPDEMPVFIIAESGTADCFYLSAKKGDGSPVALADGIDTIMAALASGVPSSISWNILRNHAAAFVSCPDWVAAKGMRILGVPVSGDQPVTSGESGAVTMGLLHAIMLDKRFDELRRAVKLNENSRVLLFSTEGDTDKSNYRRIMWDGGYESEELIDSR